MGELEDALRGRRSAGGKCLVPYLTGGLGEGTSYLRAAAAAGADAIEVGVPFSDPVMDGPVIQEASERALRAGATPVTILDELARADVGVPTAVMTYANLVDRAGWQRFASSLAVAGVSAAILPDIPLEETGPWCEAADAAGVETVLLAAPTGRAARRMSEATGVEAFTVHRLLEWRPGSEPGFGPGRTLAADLIVVDEASMINLRMFEVLLGGVAHETHLVLVGDADQLPPVGAGKPFSDLIDSGLVPTTRLTHIFRQAARSMIITAAHQVNAGAPPTFEPEADQETDLFFLDRPSADQVADSVVELVGDRVSAGLGLDPARDAQVLVPVYRGEAGIDALNERLQARLNPQGRPAFEGRFRLGDRLIQTRNAHEIGLMNGTICFLVDDDPEEGALVLETDGGETVVLPYEEARDLRLAYAISVHKSQGCEIPVVVFVCQRAHTGMLTRPLIYTAITRAKKMCVVVGDRLSLDRGVKRDDGGRRYSSLPERLREMAA